MSFNDHLGLVREDDGVSLETRPEHEVIPGLIHFAVLTTMAEVSAAIVVGAAVVPASIHVNLLSAARPGRLTAEGSLIKRGRTLSVAEGRVLQGDRLVARATVTFAMTG